MALRILASSILLLSVLFMPFWLSALLAIGAMIYFTKFYEAVIIFFLSDLLYGIPEPRFFSLVFVSSGLSLIFLIGLEYLKTKTRFYNR